MQHSTCNWFLILVTGLSLVWLGGCPHGLTSHRSVVAAEPGLVGRAIVLDAGHGGPDGGARGVHGMPEKAITLAISRYTADLLRQSGAVVYQTRVEDTDLATPEDRRQRRRHKGDLKGRLHRIRSRRPDAVVIIHCNADPSPKWSGAQTLYMTGNDEGKALAQVMQQVFRSQLLPTTREADDMNTLYLLKRVPGPVVLAEVGFVSNPHEATWLATPAYQKRIAACIQVSLLQYFGQSRS